MRKNKSKQILLAALTGLLVFSPVQSYSDLKTVYGAQVSDPHDSSLSAFDIAPGVLSPAFSPDIHEYTSTVDADVTSVSVQAVPRSTGSVIASVEGRDGLQPGVNTIKVVCAAADNTSTAYTITLTVGSASAGTQPDAGGEQSAADQPDSSQNQSQPAGSQSQPEEDGEAGQQTDTQETKTSKKKKKKAAAKLMGTVGADGTVSLSGASYRLSGNFNYSSITQDIPSAFGEGSLEIAGSSYPTLYCAANGVHLVYMENTDGKGSSGFYYYDEKQNAAERFKYMGTGEHFVIFISSARKEIPQGYTQTTLKLSSGKEVCAYQNTSAAGTDEMQDFYLIYGIYSDGTDGWYLYDSSQETYLRYADAFAVQPEEEGEQEETVRTVSLTKYNSLNEKYTELKENRVKLVSIFVIVILLLIIAFTAVLLRNQDDGGDDEDEERERIKRRKKKAGKRAEPVSKSSLAAGRDFEGMAGKRAKKVTKNITQEPEQELSPGGFHDDITPPDKIREQMEQEKKAYGYASGQKHRMNGQSRKERSAYDRKPDEQKTRDRKTSGREAYEQKTESRNAYGRKPDEQQAYEQKLGEQQAYGQKLKEQQAYEQKLSGQRAYEQKLKEQIAYEQKLKEQKLKEQQAYEQKLSEQKAYEQKLSEQKAYEQKLKEQQAYEQRLKEQKAYEQKLAEQRAYEQKPGGQRAYSQADISGGQGAGPEMQKDMRSGAQEPVNLFQNGDASGSSDSVQLAAERMRQSVRFSRGIPKAEPVRTEPEHDPMDDWDMEESMNKKPQKNTRAAKKKRRMMDDDDMEIMDLNDL